MFYSQASLNFRCSQHSAQPSSHYPSRYPPLTQLVVVSEVRGTTPQSQLWKVKWKSEKWKTVKVIFWSLILFNFRYVKEVTLGGNNIGIKSAEKFPNGFKSLLKLEFFPQNI